MLLPWYVTREELKRVLSSTTSARDLHEVDEACDAGSRSVDSLTLREFYPWYGTKYIDWPVPYSGAISYRLEIPDLIELTTMVSGGVTIAEPDRLLYPDSAPTAGRPYQWLELNRSGTAYLTTDGTAQRSVALTGAWGWPGRYLTATALDTSLTDSAGTVTVTSSVRTGVGALLRVDSECLIVSGSTLATTGATISADLDASLGDTTAPVSDGALFTTGETIVIDGETLYVDAVAGNTLVVKRGHDGSTLAAHTSGAIVYAPRLLSVERGALGTTAAAHADNAVVTLWQAPADVRRLARAEALAQMGQEGALYARTAGGGENARETRDVGLRRLRDDVFTAYGRRARHRAI